MTDDKVSPEYWQELRRRAEEKLRAVLPVGGDHDERLLALVQELQIHQVELEMQNEELRRIQTELAGSRAEYADLYDFAPVGYLSLDREGRVLRANLTAAALLGAERDRLTGHPLLVHIVAADREIFYSHLREVGLQERPAACELRLEKKTGEIFHARLESVPFRAADGSIECRTSLLDISERKRLDKEKELIRIQKLEALELLAGGIAHDFNNLLTAMLGNISLARVYLETGESPGEKMARAEQAAMRARDLVQQLLMFSGRGVAGKKAWDTALLIREAVALPFESTQCRHELILADDLWPVEVDRVQFSQVMQNLIINADQAMPQEGTITVRAENLHLAGDEQPGLAAGDYVRIAVEDRGPGISPEIRSRIFDPYFSTKPGGSGLGLAVSRALVEKFGGRLTDASRPGGGTSFAIFLPAAAAQPAAAKIEEPEAQAQVLSGRGRILIMDDNPTVREVAGELLAFLGYETEMAPEGRTAVELYRIAKEQGKPFAAVILDLVVPEGIGGQETLKHLRDFDPAVTAIVSSGYAKEPVVENFQKYGFVASLPKPYNLEQLGRVLHSTLKKAEVTGSSAK
jgi:two-component system cell cycle sensor histidine kinase/response regulator CckA